MPPMQLAEATVPSTVSVAPLEPPEHLVKPLLVQARTSEVACTLPWMRKSPFASRLTPGSLALAVVCNATGGMLLPLIVGVNAPLSNWPCTPCSPTHETVTVAPLIGGAL